MLKGWAPTGTGRAKAAHKHADIAKRERRKQGWREIRCFWTWPLGHEYDRTGRCVGCNRMWDIYG